VKREAGSLKVEPVAKELVLARRKDTNGSLRAVLAVSSQGGYRAVSRRPQGTRISTREKENVEKTKDTLITSGSRA